MEARRKLKAKITQRKAKITIIGLGYVGLPIALEFAKAGFEVFGVDNDIERLNKLKNGIPYITDIKSRDLKHGVHCVDGDDLHAYIGQGFNAVLHFQLYVLIGYVR